MATSNFSVLVDLVPDVSSLKKKLKNQNIETLKKEMNSPSFLFLLTSFFLY